MPAWHAKPKAAEGTLTGEKSINAPKHPVDVATDLNAPVPGLYGDEDTDIPLESVKTMRQALRAANARAEIVIDPEAGHAFNADYRASYHPESARDGCIGDFDQVVSDRAPTDQQQVTISRRPLTGRVAMTAEKH